MSILLIDPPVGPFSDPKEIRIWLLRLQELDGDSEEVARAREEAKRWLEMAETPTKE